MTDLNLLTFGFTNIITQKTVDKGAAQYRQVIKHQLFQPYDFYAAYGPNTTPYNFPIHNFPWGPLHSILTVNYDNFAIASDVSYYHYQSAIAHTTSITLKDKNRDAVQLALTQSYNPLINANTGLIDQQIDPTSVSHAVSLATYFNTPFIEFGGSTIYDLGLQTFTMFTLNGLIKPPGKCYGINFVYSQPLNGPPSFVVNLPIFFGNGRAVTVGRPPGL